MAYPTISVSTPANSDKKKNGAGQIRATKQHIVDCMGEISGYPSLVAIKNAKWTTSTRPTAGLVDGITGYNETTGMDEHWDATTETWVVHDGKGKVVDVQALIDAIVPVGFVALWSGTVATIPTKWHLCDGTTVGSITTVDLRSRFVVGAGVDTTSTYVAGTDGIGTGYYKPGDKGGEDKHTITDDEMPDHNHGIPGDTPSAPGGYNSIAANQGQSKQKDWTSGSAGGDDPHENRPPYYALAYIQRVA